MKPAVVKQARVPKLGYVPGVLTHSRGESPVALSITRSMAYFALLYIAKLNARCTVIEHSGGSVPRQKPRTPSYWYMNFVAAKAFEKCFLSSIRMCCFRRIDGLTIAFES